MKKISIFVCVFTSLLLSECTDGASANLYIQQIKKAFDAYDKTIANTVKSINTQVNATFGGSSLNKGIEASNEDAISDIKKLEKEYVLSEQEMIYNEQLINKLNGLVIDAETEAANIRAAKKNLEM